MQFSISRLFLPLFLGGNVLASLYGESPLNHTCELTKSYWSCTNSANPSTTDSCCTETFGGLVLSTQFWDTYTGYEDEGQLLPKDQWTLHGLWPDYCNGSYTQYCDLSRQYDPVPSPNTTTGLVGGTPVPPYTGPPITTFIEEAGKYDLLAYMNQYWVSQGAPNWYFWAHEFSKHGTCYSTFDTPCYGPGYNVSLHRDLVEFYTTALGYYLTLPTHLYLSTHNITPSNSTSYTLSNIQAALTNSTGALPYIACSGPRYNTTSAGAGSMDDGFTIIDEVWYYFHVYGAVKMGYLEGWRRRAVGADTVALVGGGSVSSCAGEVGALRYLERSKGSVRGGAGGYEGEVVLG